MTLTTIILWIATALLFAITNSISYKRGNDAGYITGMEDGIQAQLEKGNDKEYRVILRK